MEIKKLACELESWAQEKGWKTVTQLITPHHFGDLLQPLDTGYALDWFPHTGGAACLNTSSPQLENPA
ncbi:hypothetical protein KK004_21850 [Enterobacter hormaechei subsp. xiangfangensis]|uniref:hypothetical protein n=1 Tax=Enterobacter hormaechei TaxID=158836 RepID=UPI001BE03693|nr:hypothetical protein [Enterobacter hormaechei subsp. xiangfangensis]